MKTEPTAPPPVHPRGSSARVLLSSVFGPFTRDDEYGSRAINPMELYHNQVTRAQGPFSLRMSHRSWGILFIQHNVKAPCSVLDFPTRERFVRELKQQRYDVVGISGIVVNVAKVKEMCRLVREHSPHSTLVVGGHVTAVPGIERIVDADHVVKGEGVAWFRAFLGEDVDAPIAHPLIPSSFGFRLMGLPAPRGGGDPAATIIPSVGCPLGCNFCTTSAFFGGKGKMVSFYENGADLFRVMCEAEARLGVQTFFMMDENFLLYRKRALELLECMRAGGKAWGMYVFSSANAIAKYTLRELVELGIAWIWLGLESPHSSYSKLKGADTLALAHELQSHGIMVHGSSIIGLPHHTLDNIHEEIEHAVSHDADCHQFMLYTPVPGTPLYAEVVAEGRLLDVDPADIHGQYKFNFVHPHIPRDASKELLDEAFRRDYERNGPSLYRIARTMRRGYLRYHDDADARVRARMARYGRSLLAGYAAPLLAMERFLEGSNHGISPRIRALRLELESESGTLTRLATRAAGRLLLWSARREARRFPLGRPLEPPTFLERRNWAVPAAGHEVVGPHEAARPDGRPEAATADERQGAATAAGRHKEAAPA